MEVGLPPLVAGKTPGGFMLARPFLLCIPMRFNMPQTAAIIDFSWLMSSDYGNVTQLLRILASGQREVMPQLVQLVYGELRRIAQFRMQAEGAGHTLSATALVHEAYLRLARSADLRFEDRAHFFAVAAQAMRRILVDHARAKKRVRRGGDKQIDRIDDWQIAAPQPEDDILALDDALNRLAALSPRQSRVVELRYFAGLTEEQVAELLGVTRRTVNRDWLMSRTWLHRQLHPGSKNDA